MPQNMCQSSVFLTLILSILTLITKLTSAAPTFQGNNCSNTTSFANNTEYETNLKTLFHFLTSNASYATNPNGYHPAIVTGESDTIYGHFLCRGDINTSSCQDCVTTATAIGLPNYCPNRKKAIIWYDECMVRYSNRSIFNAMYYKTSATHMSAYNIIGNKTKFMELLTNMMNNDIAARAATGGSLKKFATNYVNYSVAQTIFGLGQCTPDLSPSDCETCLGYAVERFNETQGGRVFQTSCNARFEVYPFFNLSSLPPPPPSSDLHIGNRSKSSTLKTAITITVSTISTITLVIFVIFLRKKWNAKKVQLSLNSFSHEDKDEESRTLISMQYSFDTIKLATNNFSDANELGQGGFGIVYKGRLPTGKEIAVKRLSMNSRQGDAEFKTELMLVAKLHHRNLVRLLGFCLRDEERLLIYEFVPNTSLDNFLFDVSKRSCLDWNNRYKIITGIAKGLLYLHEDSRLRIIHRDLKASNILLDDELNPKIADFGTARLFETDQTQGDTNKIVGTYGYMAPEYLFHGIFSVKSDVYSFGVLVLEIITGRKNTDIHNEGYMEDLLSYVWKNWREDKALNIIDPTLSTRFNTEIIRCIHMGLLCVQENVEDRPTMSSVVLMLSSRSLNLSAPSRPAFVSVATGVETNYNQPREKSNGSSSSTTEDSITDLCVIR